MWVSNLFLIFLLIFTLFRLATYFAFKPEGFSFTDLLPSFLLGVQYDLRWIAIILLPMVDRQYESAVFTFLFATK